MSGGSIPTSGGPANAGGIGAMSGSQAAGQLGHAINGSPQWLQGMQLGQQLMQSATPRPMSGMGGMPAPQVGMPGGMPGGMGGMPGGGMGGAMQGMGGPPAMQGAVPQMPMGPGMASGSMGMPGGGMGGINPQLLQMLMRSRQM